MAPVDIIISISRRHQAEAEKERDTYEKYSPGWNYENGRYEAYRDLADEMEGLKKLFT